jgi:hypothetical protein
VPDQLLLLLADKKAKRRIDIDIRKIVAGVIFYDRPNQKKRARIFFKNDI